MKTTTRAWQPCMRWLATLLLTTMATTGCAMTNQPTEADAGPAQRFIVKFRDDSPAGRDAAAVQARLDAMAVADAAGPGVTLRWLHRTGVGADVIVVTPQLAPAQAHGLLERLSAAPDVEYAEPDGRMRIAPDTATPAR